MSHAKPSVITTYVTAVPNSVKEFHRLAMAGQADRVRGNKFIFEITPEDEQQFPLLKNGEELWIVYRPTK